MSQVLDDEDDLDFEADEADEETIVKQRNIRTEKISRLQECMAKELKMKAGAEIMLQLYLAQKREPEVMKEVQSQIEDCSHKINSLQKQIEAYEKPIETTNIPKFKRPSLTGAEPLPLYRKRPTLGAIKGLLQNLSETLERMSNKIENPKERLDLVNHLLTIIKSLVKVDSYDDILIIVQNYLCDPIQEIRASTYRVIRYLISSDALAAKACWSIGLEVFLLKSLSKDQKSDVEREQALRLIRTFIDNSEIIHYLPKGIVSLLIAMADFADDKFRNIAIETICELAIRDINLLASCGGLKTIFQILLEGTSNMVDLVVPTLIYILDSPETRKYIRPSVEIEVIISNFIDAYNKGEKHEEKLKICSKILIGLLNSWTEALTIPNEESRKIIIETLIEIFRLNIPTWLPDLFSARGPTSIYNSNFQEESNDPFQNDFVFHVIKDERNNLLENHLAILLVLFVESNLLENLIEIVENSSKNIQTRVIILIGEILELSNRLLPSSFCLRIHSLPKLFMLASSFNNENRTNASSALTHIDRIHDQRKSLELNSNFKSDRNQRQVEDIKLKLGIQLDDIHLKNLLTDSQVLLIKDYQKWNWDHIAELLQGPLLNPKRFEDVLKNTKFVKRILAFYCPYKHRFSDIKIAKGTYKYVKTGCYLIKTLLSCQEGIKYLNENKFLLQIAACLKELDPMNGTLQTDPIFSKDRLEKTLTGDFFKLIGTLCKYKEGVEVLEHFQIFNLFYKLSELRSREELIRLILSAMDYENDGHSRIILSKILTSSSKRIRLTATNFLRYLVRSNPQKFSEWGIQMLITQLYDPSIEVCEKAVMVLDEACQYSENLEALVEQSPSLDHLGEIGNPILLRFLSISSGFRFLAEMDYIEKEMEYWFNEGNEKYVIKMELLLSKALYGHKTKGKAKKDFSNESSLVLPHFFGELTKTDEGCTLLRATRQFDIFVSFVQEWSNSKSLSPPVLLKLKAALWAIGNIGASPKGLVFLEEWQIIKNIIDICKNSQILSLKGTCFYILGVISRNPEGAEILEDFDWDCQNGICIPKKLKSFLTLTQWEFVPLHIIENEHLKEGSITSKDEFEAEVLKHLGNLSNHILANQSSKQLNKLKHEKPLFFTDFQFFTKVMRIVCAYRYRMSARRFIFELFDQIDLSDHKLDLSRYSDHQSSRQTLTGQDFDSTSTLMDE